MSLWYHLHVRTPEMTDDVLLCYLRNYDTDFFRPDYLCPERAKNPDTPCMHERLMQRIDAPQHVPIGDARGQYQDQPDAHAARKIIRAVLRHSGGIQGIAVLQQPLIGIIKDAVAPRTGYWEEGAPFSRELVHRFLAEHKGKQVFVNCW